MTKTVVSASYRTDIPAFYGDWFARRLAAGYALVRNPWSGSAYRVDLAPEAVAGYVFWTRNPAPFMPVLAGLERPFAVQFTITGYGRRLEPSVPAPGAPSRPPMRSRHSTAPMRGLALRPNPVADPGPCRGRRAAGRIAARRERRMRGLLRILLPQDGPQPGGGRLRLGGPGARPPPPADRSAGGCRLPAPSHGLRAAGTDRRRAEPARCIDPARLGLGPLPEKGNRPGCACAASRDIGAYDTCPHGCLYCYANASPGAARRRFKTHDPEAEML